MAEMMFYHLTESKLETALPQLIEKSLERGYRVVIQAPDAGRRDALDTLLWTYRDDSFLPHGGEECSFAAEHPVLLAASDCNPNGADVRFFIDGVEAGDLSGYRRAVFMFDGYDEDQVARARAMWKRLREEGHALTYWQQDREGRWVKAA